MGAIAFIIIFPAYNLAFLSNIYGRNNSDKYFIPLSACRHIQLQKQKAIHPRLSARDGLGKTAVTANLLLRAT